jgi:hypothetical protein
MTIVAYVVAVAVVFSVGMILASWGGLIFVLLVAVIACFKLAGIIAWSWWVMLPIWWALGGAVVKMRIGAA